LLLILNSGVTGCPTKTTNREISGNLTAVDQGNVRDFSQNQENVGKVLGQFFLARFYPKISSTFFGVTH